MSLFRRKEPKMKGTCERCRFRDRNAPTYHCIRPTSPALHPVTGKPVAVVGRSCFDEREATTPGACGPLGVHFRQYDCGW